jgi:hypothetical protein
MVLLCVPGLSQVPTMFLCSFGENSTLATFKNSFVIAVAAF